MRLSRSHNACVCLVVLLSVAFIGSACAARSVNDVMADPGRYRNREVNIAGEVTESVGVLGKGFFKLQDESGSLWVYTSRGLPRKAPVSRPGGQSATWQASRAFPIQFVRPSAAGSCSWKATGKPSDDLP